MSEQVTLILGEERIETSRENLISKSEYFASLFSPNFRDSLSNEHRINYDIDIKTLRAFIAWTTDTTASSVGDRRRVRPSLANYVGQSADFDNLLQLLQLSLIFAAQALVNDLTDLIVCHWLIPEKSVEIWLQARELGLSMLRDLSKATCIDRLWDLPASSLTELPGEDFINLAGNVGVKDEPHLLLSLAEQWIQRNVPSGQNNPFESRYPFTLIGKCLTFMRFEEMYMEQGCARNMQCIVGRKKIGDDRDKLCIYSWDGTNFSEIVELPTSTAASTNNLIGMRAIGRGFDIYLVGGEWGKGTVNFQTEIWRYSIISKNWYYVTSMPKPRVYMAIAFVGEKLFLIGGRERNSRRRSTVDIYNVHTGEWQKAPSAQEVFTNMALCYEQKGLITLYENRSLFWYDSDESRWSSHFGDFSGVLYDENEMYPDPEYLTVNFLMGLGNSEYALDSDPVKPSRIWNVEDIEHFQLTQVGTCLTKFDNQVANGSCIVGFSYKDGTICVEVDTIVRYDIIETKIAYKEENRSDIRDFCPNENIGAFNLANPSSLNQLFVFRDDSKHQIEA